MPIFDHPGRQLRQLEEELLAGQDEQTPDDDTDFDEGEEEDTPILRRRGSGPRNYAPDFSRTVFDDEETDEEDVCYAEDRSRRKQEKGSGRMVLLALVELAMIAGVLWWWLR